MNTPSTLLLSLGNDIMGDDAVGLIAGRALVREFGDRIDFVEAYLGGIDLIELFSGYENVLLLDAVVSGNAPVGTIHDLTRNDFETVTAPSPHAAGLPEVFQIARQLQLPVPRNFLILAIEIHDSRELREGLGEEIQSALESYIAKARTILQGWTSQ